MSVALPSVEPIERVDLISSFKHPHSDSTNESAGLTDIALRRLNATEEPSQWIAFLNLDGLEAT